MTPKQMKFTGLKIDTGADKSSIIGVPQYEAYWYTFSISKAIIPSTRRIRLMGGKKGAVGEVIIQILFNYLGVIIDVRFNILNGIVHTLLSTKDIWSNGLEISIQECVITQDVRKQRLEMIDFFLVYRWQPHNLSYEIYTEGELKSIHRALGHPSIRANTNLLRKANGNQLEVETREW